MMGSFPTRSIGRNAVGWRDTEVHEWTSGRFGKGSFKMKA
jgi:predicted DNA-binding transcriptional regulator AlpA